METFRADFSLDDLGAIECKEFGEETNVFIRKHCYPELEAVLSSNAVTSLSGDYLAAEKKGSRTAVARERKRLWENQPERPQQIPRSGSVFRKASGRPVLWRTTTSRYRQTDFGIGHG
jgi:hypothetical protein